MPVIRVTRRALETLPKVAKPTIFYDTELKGFGLKVLPSGVRSWIAEFRPGISGRGTAKRRIVIGSASLISPEKARQAAKDIIAEARIGADPASKRAEDRAGITVAELADAFMAEHVEPRRKAGTAEDYRIILDKIVKPALGSSKAAKVTRAEVAKLHLSLRSIPYQANHMLAVLSAAYSFAERRGLVPEGINPTRKVEKYPEQARERYLTTEELLRLGKAIREAETSGIPHKSSTSKHAPKRSEATRTKIDIWAAAALRLLLLTGCRVGEILNLKWSEVDLERGLLFLPDSKTGRKTVVLSGSATTILVNLKRAGVYVIASESAGQKNEKPRADIKRPWSMIRRRAGLEDVRLHDLRHSFASVGAGAGMGLPVIGKLLGHTQASTTQRYAHLDTDPVRIAANAIAKKIEDAMGDGH